MIGVFRQKTPSNTVLLVLLGILLKLPTFFHGKGYILKESDGTFFKYLITIIGNTFNYSTFSFAIIGFILNMMIATMLNYFLNINRIMTKSNFLAGMAYILITSFLPAFNLLSANLVAAVLIFTAFAVMVKSNSAKSDKNNIYNAAFLIGIASLFFLPALLFIIWGFIALAILRPFRFSEWMILLLGLTTPYYFYGAYLYLTDGLQIPNYFYHLTFLQSQVQYSIWHSGALFLLLAPLFAGIFYMQANAGKMSVHVRKSWYLFLWYLAIAIIVAMFDIENTSENIVIALLPIAAFHGYGYMNAELKLFPKIAFWLSIAFIIVAQLYNPIWS